jgi:hypothetical protein
MTSEEYAREWANLAGRLHVLPIASSIAKPGERMNWALAHGLLDIEEASQAFVAKLTRLKTENLDEAQVKNLLFDIGEDLRHVMYHISDMPFFKYLLPSSDQGDLL